MNQKKYLSEDEYDHLVKVLNTDWEDKHRNVTFFFTLMHTGARVSEVLNIRCSDLNDVEKAVFIRGLKGSDDREIPVPTFLYRALSKERSRLKGQGKLFDFNASRARQLWYWYRPVRKGLHSLRHTFAIRLYKKRRDIRLLQVALGHRSINNTMVYADYVFKTSELRKLIL